MVPLFFGSCDRQLYGVYHPAAATRAPLMGVLICPPIGLEYTRAHWMLRRLADQLAQNGLPAFRFDYSGTGDSWGSLDNASVGQWLVDIEAAAEELMDNSGVRKLSVIGMRVGAILAAEAARMVLRLQHLVLWDPVVSGRTYLKELQALHQEKLARWKVHRGQAQRGDVEQILGFAYPRRLLAEIEDLDLRRDFPSVAGSISLFTSYETAEIRSLGERCQSYRFLQDAGDWDRIEEAERALLSNKIPQAALQALVGVR